MKILVLNAGSSSLKSSLYEIRDEPSSHASEPLWRGDADWTKTQGQVHIKVSTNGQTIQKDLPMRDRTEVVERILHTLWEGPTRIISGPEEINVIGHRVVHGGANYRESTKVTNAVKEEIRNLIRFAPLHNPANLEGIEICERLLPGIPQVTVFDTAFHSHLPQEVSVYPIPYNFYEEGIRRYGFHGISHQYCLSRSAYLLQRNPHEIRLVNCHLGNGSSLAAIKGGHSIDTTMGFTPLEGLMMGTRSGSIDPGIIPYLQQKYDYSANDIDHLLNKESGLKGISGVSGDMRQLAAAQQQGNERARLAIDIFVYRLRYFIGAMIASLQGIDALTFTGGIGENDANVRALVCDAFSFLGLHIDHEKNASSPVDTDIATPDSRVRVLVIHTEEDWEIASECWRLYA